MRLARLPAACAGLGTVMRNSILSHMKTVGPFVAARSLDSPPGHGLVRPVVTLHALDRLTGMPALVYLLPQAVALPSLPPSPSVLPYVEVGVQGTQAYVACELPPHAGLASDPLQTALGALRALNALHEAGITHGGVGPYQLWEWDGEVRLAGAGLPWGEPEGALAAPEGGPSPAADLYALGVTLLRMGPLPVGLRDLLSPYPAQRPSARDALARLNAGPPLPPERKPLLVQAPLHPRSPEPEPELEDKGKVAEAPRGERLLPETEPLPLIADPDRRIVVIDSAEVLPSGPENSEVKSAAEPPPQAAAEPPELEADVEALGAASDLPILNWDDLASENLLRNLDSLSALEQAPAEPRVPSPPSAEASPVAAESVYVVEVAPRVKPEARPDAEPPEVSELLNFLASFPDDPPSAAPPVEGPPEEPSSEEPLLPDEAGLPSPLTAAPEVPSAAPVPGVAEQEPDQAEQPQPPQGEDAADVQVWTTFDPKQPKVRQVAAAPRQIKPVKLGWSQDGSWQVKKDQPTGAGSADDGPPPFVRPGEAATATRSMKFSPAWIVGAVAVVLLLLLLLRWVAPRPAAVSGCCTVTSRLVGSGGQSLSAPVKVSISAAPPQSKLTAGTLVGQAPGPLTLDAPGQYALRVAGDGYAPQTVKVTVPMTQPLVITLK